MSTKPDTWSHYFPKCPYLFQDLCLPPLSFLSMVSFFQLALSWRSHTLNWAVPQAALAHGTAVFSLNTNTGSSLLCLSYCGFVCCAVIDLRSLTPVLIVRRSSSLNPSLQMVFLEKKEKQRTLRWDSLSCLGKPCIALVWERLTQFFSFSHWKKGIEKQPTMRWDSLSSHGLPHIPLVWGQRLTHCFSLFCWKREKSTAR